jgi:transposase
MRRRAKRLKSTAQRGLGFDAGPQRVARKAVLSEEFFLPDDPRDLFIGEQRLEVYLRQSGLEWVLRLRNLVEELDYSPLLPAYQATGRKAVSPRAMIGLILYGIIERQSSLRELETLAVRDVGAWWMCSGVQPDHSTIGKFIQTHAEVLSHEFFTGLVRTVVEKLRLKVGTVAADGTVIEAAASRYSLIRAEAAREAAEQARRAVESNPADVEMAEAAKAAALVAEVASERTEMRRERGRDPETVRVAPAEPEAVVQPRKDGVVRPAYKPSLLVHESGLIVGQHVHGSSEIRAVEPMLEQHAVVFAAMPSTILLDAGYFSGELLENLVDQNLDVLCPAGKAIADDDWQKKGYGGQFPKSDFVYDEGSDAYRCPANQRLVFEGMHRDQWGRRARVYRGQACATCELRSRCTTSVRGRTVKRYEADPLKEAMRQVLAQPRAREVYRQRAHIAETPFAQLGLKRFRRRGLLGARVEYALHCMAFDLKKGVRGLACLAIFTVWHLDRLRGATLIGLVVLHWRPANS